MNTTIKEIKLTLENCEEIVIPGYYIGEIQMSGIRREIARVASNAIMKIDICDEFAVEIHRDANKLPYELFGWTPDDNATIKTIFGRLLAWQDITQVDLVLTDNEYYESEFEEHLEEYSYFLNWVDDEVSKEENQNQGVGMSAFGDLYIVVSASGVSVKKKFDFVFDDSIDSDVRREQVDSHFEFCNVGDVNHQKFLELMQKSKDEDGHEDD